MLLDFYKGRIEGFQKELKQKKRTDRWMSAIRFSLMLMAASSFFMFYKYDSQLFLWCGIVFLIGFVRVLFLHLKLRKKVTGLKTVVQINENELAYHQGNLEAFDGGKEWFSGEHLFANDLDLFGHHSLFQHMNRTVTKQGKEKLAHEFLNDFDHSLQEKQQAVAELAPKVDWRQGFAVAGAGLDEPIGLQNALKSWLQKDSSKGWITSPFILYPLASITLGLLVNWIFTGSLQAFTWLSYAFMFNLFLVFSQFGKIKKEYEQLNRISKSLGLYSELLNHIENENFEAEILKVLKNRLVTEKVAASKALKKLSKLLDGFDQMSNVVALLFTNGLYHYHLHVLRGLYKWKQGHGEAIFEWLDVIAEFDRWNSKGNYAYNHPDFTYPNESSNKGISSQAMAHPFIAPSNRVANSVNFDGYKYIILTGSNMSGKSTFLRTIGINMVLMKLGLPVCAENFSAYPFKLLTSMKLVDSLDKDESYFQAEVIRLKRIKQVLETGEPCLVLLDEILRGTNSDDKRNGTRLFMQKIGSYNAVGVIATHDIDIADLARENSQIFNAKYFESKVVEGELTFDYKLRDGICKTPNATDLMKAQGII